LHNSGSATQNDTLTLLSPSSTSLIATQLASALATSYSQTETMLMYQADSTLTVRGGYRYVWGSAEDSVLPLQGLPTLTGVQNLRRNVALAAIVWKPVPRATFTVEFEDGTSSGAYFRTSLYNYRKVRGVARYQALKTLRASLDYSGLSNNNPYAGTNYLFLSHQESIALDWMPKGERFTLDGSYSHCSYHSEINYLVPQTLGPALSNYLENCHSISAFVNGTFAGLGKAHIVQVSLGGSAVLTSGTSPTTYYQPTARFALLIAHNVGVFAEWHYYGLGEVSYGYESFRAHLITAGLRFSK
jgi:hypothetical protein